MRIRRDREKHTIDIDQESYLTLSLEPFGMQNSKPVLTPMAHGVQLVKAGPAYDANPELCHMYQS